MVRIASDYNFREDGRVTVDSLPGYVSEGIEIRDQWPKKILMTFNEGWSISAGFVTNSDYEEFDQPILDRMLESFKIFAPASR